MAPALIAAIDAARAERDVAQIGIVADAAEHDLGALRRRSRSGRRFALVLRAPPLGLRSGAVVHRDVVTLPREPTRHRKTHDPESQERYVRHRRYSCRKWSPSSARYGA